ANSLAGVMAGADMVQGTINGYGERCGNANLVSVVSNLVLKLGLDALPQTSVERFSELSRTVAEIANLALPLQQPFVGHGAFAHKGGQHVAAVLRHKDAYQHIDPALVGNEARVLVSELSGRGNVLAKATVKGEVEGMLFHTAASGNGPVNAVDAALRKALSPRFPALDDVSLHDYKGRILNGDAGTAPTTRVLVESGKGTKRW